MVKKTKLTPKEIKELAGLIWLIDVYGQTSRYDNLRRMQLEAKMSEKQAQNLENYMNYIDHKQGEGEEVEMKEKEIVGALKKH